MNNQHAAYSCPKQCGRIYKTPTSLYNHLKYRCGVEPKFPCQYCDKIFYLRHHLTYHQQAKRNACTKRRRGLNIKIDKLMKTR